MSPSSPDVTPDPDLTEADEAALMARFQAAIRERTLPNGDWLNGPMTVAYVCSGCRQIQRRLVVDWVYGAGELVCFGTISSFHRVERRKDHPGPYDDLLSPQPTREESSVKFVEVLCEACHPPLQVELQDATRRIDAWWPSYEEVLARAAEGERLIHKRAPARALAVADAFTADDLTRILSEQERAELASPQRTVKRRAGLLRRMLQQHAPKIERHILSRVGVHKLWDAAGFAQALKASRQQAEDLGLTRAVRISRRVPCPALNEDGFIQLNRTARLRNPEALKDWPSMYEVDTVSPYRLLAEARSSIDPPYIGEAEVRAREVLQRLGAEMFFS